MIKLSVIVPVFNMESTLEKCVNSILCQEVEDMEIIIVDDGSKDNSAKLADKLSLSNANIKVIHQTNKGLSSARNSGIDISKGEYITFVDSDDWLKKDTYKKLIDILDAHPECEILEYSFVKSNGEKEYSKLSLPSSTYKNGHDYWFKARGYTHCYAWNKIYRREIFFSEKFSFLRYEAGRTFEDIDFLVKLLKDNPTIITTSLGQYVYRENPQGITATVTALEQAQFLDSHLKFLEDMYGKKPATKGVKQKLSKEEEDYYMAVVNIQIVLCRLSGQKPQIPLFHPQIRISDLSHFSKLIKKIILNLFGLETLCKIFCKGRKLS